MRPETESGRVVGATFDSPSSHVALLEDRTRTSAFIAALDELVRPDDVVVDIGTGTGIWPSPPPELGRATSTPSRRLTWSPRA